MRQGLFRYELGDLQTRVLPGALRFVAQLNILRGTERRKPQEISSIRQHFDAKQFNFNRIHSDEIVFEMSKEDGGATGAEPPWSCERQRSHQDGAGRMLVVINVSPLEFGHCLLIPDPALCLPQILTPFAIQIGMESIFLSSHPGFRLRLRIERRQKRKQKDGEVRRTWAPIGEQLRGPTSQCKGSARSPVHHVPSPLNPHSSCQFDFPCSFDCADLSTTISAR
ncbi:hypothetical protein Z043_110076 [Scleropages formosus]|uniref:GDPGP1-like N-terminal domain-containing protein n=1 Tax=Scleropages formosus TaxID=113540 RepID=A0A0P7UAQ0_SCLFO|nr:hypothetical protein Z043_110076 [Scleropages formosus]